MLNYEEFKNKFQEELQKRVTERLGDVSVVFGTNKKVNGDVDSIFLKKNGIDENYVSPCVYVQNAYEDYKKNENLFAAVERTIDVLEKHKDTKINFEFDDLCEMGDKVIFELINTVQNQELLESMPHREFEDLSITYRVLVDQIDGGCGSIVVNDKIAEKMGLDEEKLYELAMENTPVINPVSINNIEKIIADMMRDKGTPEEIIECMLNELPPDSRMIVVSNDKGLYGAGAILYPDVLDEVGKQFGNDFYILPSSRHEVIAVNVNACDRENLHEMVQSVNETEVELVDRLSDEVYMYDIKNRKLSMVTDGPDRKLDGTEIDKKAERRK